MTYQAIQAMDSTWQVSTEPDKLESIESLLKRAEAGDPNLSEADYERIDTANFGV